MPEPGSPHRLVVWTILAMVVAALLCWILYVVRYALLMVYMAVLAAAISPAVRCIERHHPLPCSGWRPL